MNKSPAFLFYTDNWYLDTAVMMPEEKGIYIDLLCYQHKNGILPLEIKRLAKIAGIDEGTFLQYWDQVKRHFKKENNGYVNQRLQRVVNDTLNRTLTGKVTGSLPRLLEKTKLTKAQKVKFYKTFNEEVNYQEFMDLTDEEIKKTLKGYVNDYVNYIENENENEDIYNYKILFEKISKEFNLKGPTKEQILLWLKYKSEKGQTYKETGMRTLVGSLVKKYTLTEELADAIQFSIENNYSGIFNRNKNDNNRTNTKEGKDIVHSDPEETFKERL